MSDPTLLNRLFDKFERFEENYRADQVAHMKAHSDIKKDIYNQPCKVNTFKISLLQKVVYGLVGFILLAFFVSLLPGNRGKAITSLKVGKAVSMESKNGKD